MVTLLPEEHASDANRPGFELSIPAKKSLTTVSMTRRYFTLSTMVCVLVECTRRHRKGNYIKHSEVGGRLGWKWIKISDLRGYYFTSLHMLLPTKHNNIP